MTDHDGILELLTERAAIMQYDGGLEKREAERGALLEARQRFGDRAVDDAIAAGKQART